MILISLFYQLTLYLLIRLARGGFTLGEVGIVAQGSTALFMETVNVTLYHVRFYSLVQSPWYLKLFL